MIYTISKIDMKHGFIQQNRTKNSASVTCVIIGSANDVRLFDFKILQKPLNSRINRSEI